MDREFFEALVKNQNVLNEKLDALLASNVNLNQQLINANHVVSDILTKLNYLNSKLVDIEIKMQYVDDLSNNDSDIQELKQQLSDLREEVEQFNTYNHLDFDIWNRIIIFYVFPILLKIDGLYLRPESLRKGVFIV